MTLDPDQTIIDIHNRGAGVENHFGSETQGRVVLDPGQQRPDTHFTGAGVENHVSSDTQASRVLGPGHCTAETQLGGAGVENHLGAVIQRTPVLDPGWLELRIWCEQLDDAEQARIAAVNRAERGLVDPTVYRDAIVALQTAEHVCELGMRRCYRRVTPPEIVAWQKGSRGIGEKLTARLLGHLGDPCLAFPHHWEGSGATRRLVADAPFHRTVSQLWQYCGVGDPQRRRFKGMTVVDAFGLGNPMLKKLIYLHATSCVKTGGPYRDVYDSARLRYIERVHADSCGRCGPSGKPAIAGSPWSRAHQHAAALRLTGKEILRDLWIVRHGAVRRGRPGGDSGGVRSRS